MDIYSIIIQFHYPNYIFKDIFYKWTRIRIKQKTTIRWWAMTSSIGVCVRSHPRLIICRNISIRMLQRLEINQTLASSINQVMRHRRLCSHLISKNDVTNQLCGLVSAMNRRIIAKLTRLQSRTKSNWRKSCWKRIEIWKICWPSI